MTKGINTIGWRLKKENCFDDLSQEEVERLNEIVAKIKGLMWKNIYANNLLFCKYEGDEIATMLSFSGDEFNFYMDNEFLGKINLYNFYENTGRFYTLYVPYMNSILKLDGIKIYSQFTEYPVIFKIVLL